MLKPFGGVLTLARNSRGCYILDTVKGCRIVNTRQGGCYGDCYAANIAKRYHLDFGSPVSRLIVDEGHKASLIRQIKAANMPFIRIGEMGDPSEDWGHTLDVCRMVLDAGKDAVVITKHWKPVPDSLLPGMEGICVNTSVSALDEASELSYRLEQYERLKPFCRSVLRVVSCRFNRDSEEGAKRQAVQDQLLSMGCIETVFRPSPKNPFLVRGVIQASPRRFLGTVMLASMDNVGAYFGGCAACPDLCGVRDCKPGPRIPPPKAPDPLPWDHTPKATPEAVDFFSLTLLE